MKHINESLFAFLTIEIICVVAAAFLNRISDFCSIQCHCNLYVILPAFGFVVSIFYPIVLYVLYLKSVRDIKNGVKKGDILLEDENGNRLIAAERLNRELVVFIKKNNVINEVSLTYIQRVEFINWLRR